MNARKIKFTRRLDEISLLIKKNIIDERHIHLPSHKNVDNKRRIIIVFSSLCTTLSSSPSLMPCCSRARFTMTYWHTINMSVMTSWPSHSYVEQINSSINLLHVSLYYPLKQLMINFRDREKINKCQRWSFSIIVIISNHQSV